jgi:hypothetical protein|tara:strand:+ start:727 stop:921 length:195 start_codon:yes stop_codon:yes gene_type:complete
MNTELWLLATAVIFTYVGKWMQSNVVRQDINKLIEATIDRLIEDGYVKTRLDENGEVELVKHGE